MIFLKLCFISCFHLFHTEQIFIIVKNETSKLLILANICGTKQFINLFPFFFFFENVHLNNVKLLNNTGRYDTVKAKVENMLVTSNNKCCSKFNASHQGIIYTVNTWKTFINFINSSNYSKPRFHTDNYFKEISTEIIEITSKEFASGIFQR